MPANSREKNKPAWSRSVFINCPFDEAYKPLMRAACFAIIACGYTPRCALDYNDSGAVRLVEIARMISECGFSIHDISRVELDRASRLPRFNMPLELGMDLGLRLQGSARQKGRRTLILDAVAHQYDKTLSDISGLDPQFHRNDARTVIRHVRDWLNAYRDPAIDGGPPGARAIYDDYLAYTTIAPDIIQALRLDSPLTNFLTSTI
ncbi:MAG TPA: hypothetical protein VHB27_19570 [Rhodopila sp.]|uniref:hypothetical protein n=1 Tax=Rhodopila sp. TaxID=2480087 RepID=UPI002B658827|nr:hypothetical protein [Rhodopila sp.]HVY17431.1 hypothetical protein [Rhodopila sp.]